MEEINNELELISSPDFKLGEYIYLGMGITDENHKIVMSVGYKIDYALKKALQAETNCTTITHISKVKVGELVPCYKFIIDADIYGKFIEKFNLV